MLRLFGLAFRLALAAITASNAAIRVKNVMQNTFDSIYQSFKQICILFADIFASSMVGNTLQQRAKAATKFKQIQCWFYRLI
jgi:hypothetical protein